MKIERFNSGKRMSQVVKHGDTLYLCGLVSGENGVAAQTQDILNKIDALLLAHGSDKEHILRATIFIKDMASFDEMNAVWDAWTGEGISPARACVQAAMAREDILVEIVVDAAVK